MSIVVNLPAELEYRIQQDADKLNIPKARIVRGILKQYYNKKLYYRDVDGKLKTRIPWYLLDCGIKTP